ncbi:MAG: FAD-dependent oxidoreductase, partial [Oscillospiraceae bacterium]|nr:FAD-dependent oxidoreductase [Oscillospiraceae bacterium]
MTHEKKHRLIGIIGVIFLAAVLLLNVVLANGAAKAAQAQKEAEIAALSPEAVALKGTAAGRNGPIDVEVITDGNEIFSVKVLNHTETDGIGSVAVDEIPAAVVEQQSTLVDSISGATVTSDAIKKAISAALTEGGFDASAFEVAAAAVEGPASEMLYEVDVVVVGGGGAGMTAAITAADEGRTVLLLESQGMVGGNSVRSTGGMNAAPTEWQQANEFKESAGVESTLAKLEKYPDNERIQELGAIVAEQWAAYQENPEGYFESSELFQLDTLIGGGGLNDPSLVKKLVENSGSAISWLDQLDPEIVLHNVAQFGGASVKRIHRPVDADGKVLSVGAYVVPLLKQNLDARGIEVLTNTTATELLTDDSGAVVGVLAETKNGGSVTVNAKAVVITTGGFGANNDMIASIRPEL